MLDALKYIHRHDSCILGNEEPSSDDDNTTFEEEAT